MLSPKYATASQDIMMMDLLSYAAHVPLNVRHALLILFAFPAIYPRILELLTMQQIDVLALKDTMSLQLTLYVIFAITLA